ncbi:transcription termination/antitermination protein NusG [Corynebacterium kefirresidentii]|uniref:Transcription termination/antitermination protein NusG n=1 Tax=Corynebacterium kefirresidentii TaxID=1979527 RepID=A0ABT8Q3B1_9CORY|nr:MULTISPECIES: transcription termination/antitermination protein NusG [Corynebacterium]WKS54628.1 transcription termination/antitermination protein NusG [Corynebacterium tuberculostearicum]ERS48765.1 transcription termination/antitermination factor NusG [Corynebacterium sp. KPL1856]ERS49295.1 transcription termination/antitermination factor NusG [Corynebacterium sp. KPL1860]ERS53974.1 transcription termination/antitermination factor NusG [Corynebacterium sp. KPL1821]ERS60188.1 transcription 
MSDENNVETVGTSLEEAMQANVQEQAAEHASSVEEAQQEDATPSAPAVEEAAESTDAAGESAEAAEAPGAESESAAADAEGAAEAAAPEAGEDESEDAAYRKRLRAFTRELKKQPGQWYIIQCYSGYENKVKTNLDMRAQTLEVEDSIFEVVVPIEQVLENKDGKKKIVKRKLLPGYVLVRAELNDAAWSVIRETPGVTSFVGNEGNATPVKTRDVAKFLMPNEAPSTKGDAAPNEAEGEQVVAMPEKEVAKKYAHDFEVGEAVTILSGPLAAVSATISEIDPETGKMQGLVSIFGRETPVELSPTEIERIS